MAVAALACECCSTFEKALRINARLPVLIPMCDSDEMFAIANVLHVKCCGHADKFVESVYAGLFYHDHTAAQVVPSCHSGSNIMGMPLVTPAFSSVLTQGNVVHCM